MHVLKTGAVMLFCVVLLSIAIIHYSTAGVVNKGDRVFIVDRTGEQWDITQAVSLGFKPRGFQFGIGRNAIVPLDDASLAETTRHLDAKTRVIGVENGKDAHAYVVRKLTLHEIANTTLGDTPIAAAY